MEFWQGAEELAVWGYVVRAIIVYVYIFFLVKVLGQRSMGSIDPLDFIFGVIIGDVVGEPLSSGDLPLGGPLAAATLIGAAHWSLSVLSLHMPRFRRIVEDEPLMIIEKGQILHDEMRKAKMTMESLLMDLRNQGASDLNEIDYAILEPAGSISVIKKSRFEPVTLADQKQHADDKGFPSVWIEDGHLITANITKKMKVEDFLEQLNRKGYQNVKSIFLLTVNEKNEWYVSEKISN
ncbi:DUF421 domain-containing protein [Salsuginibacillus kocurii]|uniref:DUF421 domain-containing protein n=1 Tax=Salsuginibacillus kocurii TaxID=427078 RepID=UPI00037A7D00|nr:DUF421 domain-containing protein [Salsuginibacillus kocurii]